MFLYTFHRDCLAGDETDRRVAVIILILMIISPPLFASGQYAGGELVLRVGMQDDIKSLNPIQVSDVWSWNILQWIYEKPILIDYDSSKIMPYIAIGTGNISGKAESWGDCTIGNFGYSPASSWQDPTKAEAIIFYDFTNVTWHDGTPMTVRDVMFSFHVAARTNEPSLRCLMDSYVAGVDWNTYLDWDPDTMRIEIVWEEGNSAALRFTLVEQYSAFFSDTISPLLLPYHIWGSTASGQNVDGAKIWCDPGYNASADDSWQVAPAQSFENNPPIGSGIMKFEFWTKGQISKISTFREHFYSEDYTYKEFIEDNFPNERVKQPTIDAISFKLYRTAEAAFLAMKYDDIDYIAWSVPPSFVRELSMEPGITMFSIPESAFYYLGYNMRKHSFGYNRTASAPYAPEDDVGKPLRRAIAHCIDRNRIVTRLLLNLGSPGAGPVPPSSEWHNSSVPKYAFDPDEAKRILADAGYLVKKADGTLVGGNDAIAIAGNGNWWVNPDGTNIGSGSGGCLNILTPEANYDPIRAQAGLMLSSQLQTIGILAQSAPMDFGSIVDRIDNRDYDMYILGWKIGSDPTDFLHAFFDSSNAEIGQNYVGYQNDSFDALLDLARRTEDPDVKKNAIFEAQAAICYDLPVDVLYYRKTVLAARTDRFTGWVLQNGGVFNRASIVNLRGPFLYKLNSWLADPTFAVFSNSTTQMTALVTGDQGIPMQGCEVTLDASIGKLNITQGITSQSGRLAFTFTAPYVPPTPENANGTPAMIQIFSATTDAWEYAPAPPRFIMVTVYPEEARFMAASLRADPNVIEDVTGGKNGFTYVDVTVKDQDDMPVIGALVTLSCRGSGNQAVPDISPEEAMTDEMGKARFSVTSRDLWDDDNSVQDFAVIASVEFPENGNMTAEGFTFISVVDIRDYGPLPPPPPEFPVLEAIAVLGAIFVAAVVYVSIKGGKRK